MKIRTEVEGVPIIIKKFEFIILHQLFKGKQLDQLDQLEMLLKTSNYKKKSKNLKLKEVKLLKKFLMI